MKKIISWILLISFFIGYNKLIVCATELSADQLENMYYMDEYYSDIYDSYRYFMDESSWKLLREDKHNAYVGLINNTENLNGLIQGASTFIGENLDEQKYMEILINLLGTMEVEIADVMTCQAQADTLKQLNDYVIDVTDIVVGTISTESIDFDALNTDISKRISTLLDSIEINNVIKDFVIADINALENYEMLMQKYNLYHDLLDVVIHHSNTPELKKAAYTLNYMTNQALYAKLTCFGDITGNLAKSIGKDIFFDNIVIEMLDNPEILTDSIENQEALKLLGKVSQNLNLSQTSFKLGIFVGDMIFGTSNTYNRYNEIYVMKQLRDALIQEIELEDRKITEKSQYDNIEKVLMYIKYLLYVNSRGEYCMHSLMTKDAQLMSLISIKNFDDYDEWFESVQFINNSLAEHIKHIIPDLDNYRRNPEDFNILSQEDICKAINNASKFAWDWFWDSNREHVDEFDTYIGKYENIATWEYKRVTTEGIKSIEDVVELTKHYFTEEVTYELLSQKGWYSQDDKLYVSEPDGIGGPEADYYDIKIIKNNAKKYTITIYEYFFDELWCDPYDVHLEYIDGYWVFDKILFQMNETMPINVIGEITSEPEPVSNIDLELYYGVWSNCENTNSNTELLDVTFESYEAIADVSATIAAQEYAIGTCFFHEDGSFSCCLIIDSMYNNLTQEWEPAYAKAYLNGTIKTENCIDCTLQYEGSNSTTNYLLYRID